ncbi:MAG: DAK2 domain-containing protein [Candidatus Dormibacteraeota bacterium]|uniref:DAK2 domain-containing protein n=1 Tax=Candidatus Aeolococcus gillhamiae TaxID=3127015 RepID=A0A934JU21_9BACT|nr:DAK2 domain-containing protein [Candidatus Dormibacteraeota bacterium]
MSAEAGSKLTLLREPVLTVGGVELLAALRSALAWLQANQEEINDLNVFPVPDGDTGSNMYLTLRSAVEEAQSAADPSSAAAVLGAAAHGSLMGARGNSGVILSQILRGVAQGVGSQPRLDAGAWARGLREARTVAYKAVMKPTEGTILTVVREAAEAAGRAAEESSDVATVLEQAVRASHAAVERTTEQLQVLRDAGVVDAGGFGLAVILEGLSRAIADPAAAQSPPIGPRRRAGEDRVQLPFGSADAAPRPSVRRGAAAVEMKEEGWGYCTEFLIHGPGLDPERLRDELGKLGESALVVGDPELVRVHIHTGEPAPLIALASSRGRLSKLKVEDMSAQHHDVLGRADAAERPPVIEAPEPAADAPRKAIGVVSVAPGQGFRDILASLGADAVVEGGQTMNPSIEDLLNGVRAAHAEKVVLLPNNGNVILTAEQVNGLIDDCEVKVVPTRNLPQGISALLALEPDSTIDANAARMSAAIKHVHALEVTRAVRDSTANGHEIKEGDVLGILDDEIREVGSDEPSVIEAVLGSVDQAPELVTVYRGGDVTPADAEALVERMRATFADTEFELHDGGQEHYSYVLSLE